MRYAHKDVPRLLVALLNKALDGLAQRLIHGGVGLHNLPRQLINRNDVVILVDDTIV